MTDADDDTTRGGSPPSPGDALGWPRFDVTEDDGAPAAPPSAGDGAPGRPGEGQDAAPASGWRPMPFDDAVLAYVRAAIPPAILVGQLDMRLANVKIARLPVVLVRLPATIHLNPTGGHTLWFDGYFSGPGAVVRLVLELPRVKPNWAALDAQDPPPLRLVHYLNPHGAHDGAWLDRLQDPALDVLPVELYIDDPAPEAEAAGGIRPYAGLRVAVGADLRLGLAQLVAAARDHPMYDWEAARRAAATADLAAVVTGAGGGAAADDEDADDLDDDDDDDLDDDDDDDGLDDLDDDEEEEG